MNTVVGVVGSIALSFAIGSSVSSYSKSIEAKASIENGLEECPNYRSGSGSDTIWVRSCTEFTNNYFGRTPKEDK